VAAELAVPRFYFDSVCCLARRSQQWGLLGGLMTNSPNLRFRGDASLSTWLGRIAIKRITPPSWAAERISLAVVLNICSGSGPGAKGENNMANVGGGFASLDEGWGMTPRARFWAERPSCPPRFTEAICWVPQNTGYLENVLAVRIFLV
jgi:hypothetical protein